MNGKKGITGVLLLLIVSGIAISLLFLGIFFAYKSMAEAVGVKFDISTLKLNPYYGYKSKIIILSVDKNITNQTYCNDSCNNDESCKLGCVTLYPIADANYSHWFIKLRYEGFVRSPVEYRVIENCTKGDEETIGLIALNNTPPLVYWEEYGIDIIKEIFYECTGNISFYLSAINDPGAELYHIENGKEVKGPYNESNEFCASPPPRDVNVSINEIWFDTTTKNIIVNASITGSDVFELCPNASGVITMTNETDEEEVVEPYFTLETNRSRRSGGWYDWSYLYRIKFYVHNDLGVDVSNEVAVVNLSFKQYQDYYNITDCSEIVITDESNKKVGRNITSETYDSNGYCINATIEFVVDSIGSGETKYFYAYFGSGTSTLNDDVSQYYPKYTVCVDQACTYNFTDGSYENLTLARYYPYLTLNESKCKYAA